MAIRKIRSSWWVDFRVEGQRYRMRSPENSRAGASAYELVVRQRLARGNAATPTPRPKKETLSEFASEWQATYVRANNKPSEQRNKALALKNHLLPVFGKLSLADIDAAAIESYKLSKLQAGQSAKSVNLQLAILAKCLSTAHEWGRLAAPPRIKHLKTVSQRLDFLSDVEAQRIIDHADEPVWREMVHLALRTGLRLGELLGLEWQDVDLVGRQLTVARSIVRGIVGTPKNGKTRYVPLTSDVTAALQAMPRRNLRVFCRNNGNPFGYSDAGRAIERLCRRAGVRQVSWHVLRHTFASHLAARNVPLPIIKDLLGHSTIAMTMRYAHLSQSSLRDAVQVLEPRRSETFAGAGRCPPVAHETVTAAQL